MASLQRDDDNDVSQDEVQWQCLKCGKYGLYPSEIKITVKSTNEKRMAIHKQGYCH
jgi:hypothetical protein